MTTLTEFRALAGQSPARVIAKAALSLLVVGIAAFFSREGLALAIIIVFTGVTGPAIRLVTMKMEGTYDRILVSPCPKARFFSGFALLWAISVLLPLVPAVLVVAVRNGPVTIVPVISGTVLAVTLGTLAGFVSQRLSDAHLSALLVSGLLIALTVLRTPADAFIPFSALVSHSSGPAALLTGTVILPVAAIALLALAVSRS
jgi:hypothetical protein